MKITKTNINGLFLCDPKVFEDERGAFVKTFHEPTFLDHGCVFKQSETMYSVSHRGVIRGMHFQAPPSDHAKLVYCLKGAIVDVVVDIRASSPTFGNCHSELLTEENKRGIFVPSGFAHGFVSLANDSLVSYGSTHIYSPEDDMGIRWDSFGFEWPLDGYEAKLSHRDLVHPTLAGFTTPFA